MKNKIYLVTDSVEIIQKLRTFTESQGPNHELDLQVFSKVAWSENLESPFLRARLMDKPMLLPGSKMDGGSEENSGVVTLMGQDIHSGNIDNVVSFPKTGQMSGQVVSMQQLEKAAIIQAIESCRGNLSLAAKSLGLGRATLYRKLKQYSIEPKELKNKVRRKVA